MGDQQEDKTGENGVTMDFMCAVGCLGKWSGMIWRLL